MRRIVHCSLFTLLAAAFVAASCQRPLLYSYQPVAEEGWSCTDTLRFAMDELPANGTYALRVGVRCNNLFAYRNLWLVVERRIPSEANHRDTLQLDFSDETGTEFSSGNILHEQEQTVGVFRVRKPQQPIELLVYHVMEEQLLKGVTEVGVQVSLSDE